MTPPLLFQRLRLRLVRNGLGVLLRHSPIRLASILLFSFLICGGLFALSWWGFDYLRNERIPFAGGIIGMLFDFMFLALTVMLVFSTGLILFSSLFSSPETAFLLCTPAAVDQVFAYKYQGAVAFSSWAFLLLGGPVLVAYGLVYHVPWHFYVLLPLFFLGFVLLPGSFGALACLVVVNVLPQRRKQVMVLTGALVLGVAGYLGYRAMASLRTDVWSADFMQQMVGRVAFAQSPVMPSHWITQGLQASALGNLPEAGYRLALIWSNGLFLYIVTAWLSSHCYRRGFNRIATGGSLRRRYGGHWLDRAASGLLGFLDPQTRLLMVKDFRTFRRDPAQWAQVLIFTGLLTLYFANTRQFYQEEIGRSYQNGISLLNLASVALLLCAYTGRFIYPMLSLEGRKFWVLGLLPLRRERLLWGKFAFSATGAVLIAEFLVVFSDLALGMPAEVVALHALTVAVLALGLSGLAVGIGALMPNFRESDPSKVAVGFGGTLNLVVSLLFLILVVGLMAAPWHLVRAVALAAEPEVVATRLEGWLTAGVAAGTALGAAAVVVPLQIGARSLRRMEF